MRLLMNEALVTKIEQGKQFINKQTGEIFNYSTLTILHDGKTVDFTAEKEFDLSNIKVDSKYNFLCTFRYRKLRIAGIA